MFRSPCCGRPAVTVYQPRKGCRQCWASVQMQGSSAGYSLLPPPPPGAAPLPRRRARFFLLCASPPLLAGWCCACCTCPACRPPPPPPSSQASSRPAGWAPWPFCGGPEGGRAARAPPPPLPAPATAAPRGWAASAAALPAHEQGQGQGQGQRLGIKLGGPCRYASAVLQQQPQALPPPAPLPCTPHHLGCLLLQRRRRLQVHAVHAGKEHGAAGHGHARPLQGLVLCGHEKVVVVCCACVAGGGGQGRVCEVWHAQCAAQRRACRSAQAVPGRRGRRRQRGSRT